MPRLPLRARLPRPITNEGSRTFRWRRDAGAVRVARIDIGPFNSIVTTLRLNADAALTTLTTRFDEWERAALVTLAAEEAKVDGWDGYNGRRVGHESIKGALAFLRVLPTRFPQPEIGPSPRGGITFDWFVTPDRNLTVSLGPGPRLFWASLREEEATHGQIDLPIKAFPPLIESALRLLYEQ